MPALYPQILVSLVSSRHCVLEAGWKNPQQRYLTARPPRRITLPALNMKKKKEGGRAPGFNVNNV